MTHYSNEARSVRIDIFKTTGKWYATEAMPWYFTPGTTWEKPAPMWNEFMVAVRRTLGDRYTGMTIVCLEPYHPNAYPLLWQNYNYREQGEA